VVLCPRCPLKGKCMGMHFYGDDAFALGDDSATRAISGTADGQKLMWYVDGSTDDRYEVGVNDETLVSLSDTWFVAVRLADTTNTLVDTTAKISLRTRFGMNACYTHFAPATHHKKTAKHDTESDSKRRRLAFLNAMPSSAYTSQATARALSAATAHNTDSDVTHTKHPTAAPVEAPAHTPNEGTITNEIVPPCQEYVAASAVNGFDYPTLAVNLHRKPPMPTELDHITGTCTAVQKVWCYQTHYMCDKNRNGLALKPAPSVCLDLQGFDEDGERDDKCGSLVPASAKKMHHLACNLAPDEEPVKSNFGDVASENFALGMALTQAGNHDPNTFPKAPTPLVPCEPVHFACETPECYLTRRPLGCICRSGRQPECQIEW